MTTRRELDALLTEIREDQDRAANTITDDDLQPETPTGRTTAAVCNECRAPLNVERRCAFCHDPICPVCGCCACHCGGWS